MVDCIKSAFRNLKRKQARTALTILGIAVGVASIITISNISRCGTNVLTGEMESLGLGGLCVTTSGNSQGITLKADDLAVIKNLKQVEQAAPIIMENTKITLRNENAQAILWGIDSQANKIISLEVIHGRLLSKKEVSTAANVCLVDENISNKLYRRGNIIGKQIPLTCGGIQQKFKVVGVVKTGTGLLQNIIGEYIPTFIYIPYTTIQSTVGRNDFDEIAIKIKAGNNSDSVGQLISNCLNSSNGTENSFKSSNFAKQKDGLTRILNIIALILSSVGVISLFVAGLSIMTVMLVSVNERTREIGIKKALGATNGTIMLEFLFEAVLISAIGCVFGIAAGYLVSYLSAVYFKTSLAVNADIILIAGGLAILSGTIFGVYPAYKASKLKPVDALRQE